MHIERAAYASRWRGVAPSAKGLFALAGMAAAWSATRPAPLAGLALLLAFVTLALARVPLRLYLAVIAPPLGFMAVSCVTMLMSVDARGWHWTPALLPAVATTALRSLAMLAAMLGLVLTTPLPDLLGLLRRVGVPALLLDLMVLCYRMLFVLRQAWDDGVAAQSARLGYHRTSVAWRSIGLLAGQMAVQVWQRAAALQTAALARAHDGQLRFLPAVFPHARRQDACALLAGALLVLGVCLGERW